MCAGISREAGQPVCYNGLTRNTAQLCSFLPCESERSAPLCVKFRSYYFYFVPGWNIFYTTEISILVDFFKNLNNTIWIFQVLI